MPMSIDPASASRIRDLVKMRDIPAPMRSPAPQLPVSPMVPALDPMPAPAAPTVEDMADGYEYSADPSLPSVAGMGAKGLLAAPGGPKKKQLTYMAGPRSGGTGVPNRYQARR